MKTFCLQCDCGSHEHDIWFEYDEEEKSLPHRELTILTNLRNQSFWKRVRIAYEYIFRNTAMYNDMCVFDEKVADLEDFLMEYRNS